MNREFVNRTGPVEVSNLRRRAVSAVAEHGLLAKRYQDERSARNTIHDAYARRLKSEIPNIRKFDELVELWLRKQSTTLKTILLKHSFDRSQRSEIDTLFGSTPKPLETRGLMPHDSRPRLQASEYEFADASDIEGIKTEVVQFRGSRSQRLRKAAREAAKGKCCVCDRDFSKVLGGRGVRVLQLHHRDQLAALTAPTLTKVDDLAVVCANCHMLLHFDPKKSLRVEDLREMLRADRSSAN